MRLRTIANSSLLSSVSRVTGRGRLVVSLALGLWTASTSCSALAGDGQVSLEYGTTEYTSGTDTSMSGQHLYTSFKGAAQGTFQTRFFDLYSDIKGLVTVNERSLSYINPSEFYLVTPKTEAPAHLYVGRKKTRWNRLDEQWQLGLWQPRYRWDYFHPDADGLTGLFVGVEQQGFQLLLWGSPVFIPESTAPFNLENGKFTSSHPFFTPPRKQSWYATSQTTPIIVLETTRLKTSS